MITKKNTYVRKHYSAIDLAYLAGIIDGEGSIYIGNFSSNASTGAKYYQTNMEVANTDKALIDWLECTFGGLVNSRTPRQHAANARKQVWIWVASGDRLTHLCECILPYVKIKRRQVEIMLEMRSTYKGAGKGVSIKGFSGVQPHSPELLAHRQRLMDEMRALHIRVNHPVSK